MADMETKDPQVSPDFPDSFHRVAIKGLYVKDGKLLMVHDFVHWPDKQGAWELPGGGLDFGETPAEALTREVKEEMGLTVTSVADKPTYVWTKRLENCRGMEWWHALLIGYKMDLQDLNFTPTPECKDIKFFSKEELL